MIVGTCCLLFLQHQQLITTFLRVQQLDSSKGVYVAKCLHWLRFGGTNRFTYDFSNIDKSWSTPFNPSHNFKCTDKEDCCKWTPKAGPYLFWSDNSPYDNFSNSSISEAIPNRYSQHRVKYLAEECASASFSSQVTLPFSMHASLTGLTSPLPAPCCTPSRASKVTHLVLFAHR
jgi:hypothetical protein